ncbi:alpha/beta hydrolase [Aliidongia dinghuensis]|uniref:Alpha/beta hydrolase n=1 Tax=Aliidongia dinghuensis TaxID=1867774 RepID=A0A8J2YRA4_9PROT|nr:alpha/beta fold hydrolase [Aliidongia dinghuensis]GGF08008.1 alpha/beta hydrolase [Aliidongia dinghuensis]
MLPWKPELEPRAEELARALDAVELRDFAEAVESELAQRADRFAAGIEAYRRHPYRRALADPPEIWRSGTTRLIDYGPEHGRPVLVVPSLINRAYVLDLAADRSLLRYLAARGIRPLLVDWDKPGETERQFDLTAYIAGRLDAAFEAALDRVRGPIGVVGYCMGGLLALALALRRRREVAALGLLATPWDFQAGNEAYARFVAALAGPADITFGPIGWVPTDMLQTLFFMADPHLAIRKFSRFADLDPNTPEALNFVATEDWLNDGVPLALPTAKDCFGGWYGENQPVRGTWSIAGQPVAPGHFDRPALVIAPARDRLVPPASARPLAAALPKATLIEPDLGHIGLIVAGRAPAQVWAPLGDWLERHVPQP